MEEEAALKDIINNPDNWVGKEVILTVDYLGWGKGNCDLTKSSLRTRSDITLRQGDYCIFCDPIENLSPITNRNIKIKIKAVVEILTGRPRLRNPVLLEILEE